MSGVAKVTVFDARKHIDHLVTAGYRLPDGTTVEKLGKVWVEVLEGVSMDELADAVREYLRNGSRYWPKPYELRQLAMNSRKAGEGAIPSDLRSRYFAWEQSGEGPCPICGAVMQSLTASQRGAPEGSPPRFGFYHDAMQHWRRNVPWVGYPHPKETKDGPKLLLPGDAA